MAAVIPKLPFIRHATLVSVPLSVQLEDLWHVIGARYGQCAEMGCFIFQDALTTPSE